jgi:SAM-dependent methyltransferase
VCSALPWPGKCSARPELAEEPLPLTARLPALPCRGGENVLHRLFEPLGYKVRASQHPQRSLRDEALAKLLEDGGPEPEHDRQEREAEEEAEEPLRLNEQRLGSVVAVLKSRGAKRVLDLGCGSGKLITELMKDPSFEAIAGVDISHRALEIAASRLQLDRLAPRHRERVQLFQSALTYRDRRLSGFDAAAVVEVIEHLDRPRLSAFETSSASGSSRLGSLTT